MTAAERLFGPLTHWPPPPDKWAEYRLEWIEGYKVGWEVGPGRESPSLWDKTKAVRAKHWGNTALSGARGAAFKAGKDAGRAAKRDLIAELWPAVQQRGREHTQTVNNWPRTGWAYQDAFFYFFGTGKMPIASPLVCDDE
jgi:hypothetical protein